MMGETFEAGSWNVEMEVNLFHAMRGHKPVGVNRHFHMVVIHEKLSSPSTKKLTAKDVWNHLSTMYDLQALNESEILPFPNKPTDFKLPEGEYKLSDDTEFPRMQIAGVSLSSSEEVKAKPEGQAKGGKASRSDSKATHLSKIDSKGSLADPKGSASKGDYKNTTPESKSSHMYKTDSKSGSSSSGRGEGKGGGKGGHSSSGQGVASTPDPSPKRTKRTRHNQSATNSPASDAPPAKRRR